jgi:hypothetical protein
MTEETGTLAELDVKSGDVVSYKDRVTYTIFGWKDGECYALGDDGFPQGGALAIDTDGWRIIIRASGADDQPSATPKTWGEMTDKEKGALLLAEHRGEVVEWRAPEDINDDWDTKGLRFGCPDMAYRVRPEPKQETVTLYGCGFEWGQASKPCDEDTHRITFDLIDGKPDCASIRMEEDHA